MLWKIVVILLSIVVFLFGGYDMSFINCNNGARYEFLNWHFVAFSTGSSAITLLINALRGAGEDTFGSSLLMFFYNASKTYINIMLYLILLLVVFIMWPQLLIGCSF